VGRRSALGVRMDGDAPGGARRWSSDVGPAAVDCKATEGGSDGRVKLVRLDLPRGSEVPWRAAACPEFRGNRSGPFEGQRLGTAARAQISASGRRFGAADECETDNEGCETVREAHDGLCGS